MANDGEKKPPFRGVDRGVYRKGGGGGGVGGRVMINIEMEWAHG